MHSLIIHKLTLTHTHTHTHNQGFSLNFLTQIYSLNFCSFFYSQICYVRYLHSTNSLLHSLIYQKSLSIYLSPMSVWMSVHRTFYLSNLLSVLTYIYVSIFYYLYICLSLYLHICLYIYTYVYIYLSIHLSIYLYI